MKVEELRIGNYLKSAKRNNFFEVSYEDLGYINDGASKSEPIPLTEEILLKCGFEKNLIYDFFELGEFSIKVDE